MNSAWLVIAATAAGVLLPKVLPGLLLPDRVPAPIAACLVYVPAGMLGAFTAITAAGYVGPSRGRCQCWGRSPWRAWSPC